VGNLSDVCDLDLGARVCQSLPNGKNVLISQAGTGAKRCEVASRKVFKPE